MSVDSDILTRLEAVRTGLLQEAADHGYGRSPRRGTWERAKLGWIVVRELHLPQLDDAGRQRFSRAVRHLVASGVLEANYDSGGRILEVRTPPAPKLDAARKRQLSAEHRRR